MTQVQIEFHEGDYQELMDQLLTHLPNKVGKVNRAAVRKTATVYKNGVKKVTPYNYYQRRSSDTKRGHLRDALVVSSIPASKLIMKDGGVSVVGPESNKAPHKHLVEFGTQERYLKSPRKFVPMLVNATSRPVVKEYYGRPRRFKKKIVVALKGVANGNSESERDAAYVGATPRFSFMSKTWQKMEGSLEQKLQSEIVLGANREFEKAK